MENLIASKYRLKDHPWIALIVIIITYVFILIAAAAVILGFLKLDPAESISQLLQSITSNLLLLFVIIPFILRLPKGNKKLIHYLFDIGLLRLKPLSNLLIIGFTCYLIFLFSQAFGTITFRITQGEPITMEFIKALFKFSQELPSGLLLSFPSVFEEILFRGVILTMFLNKYSSKKAILFSAASFALIHLLNIFGDKELVWVTGQVVWAFIIGLFYGYLFVRTKSLLPVMLVHYLGNLFIGTLTGYIQANASVEIDIIYGIIFSFGLIPTTLSIIWVRFFLRKWPIYIDE